MSYPPLRSWPMAERDFPPPEPDHWFKKTRKWIWPSVLAIILLTVTGCSIAVGVSVGLAAAGWCLMCLIIGAMISAVAALIAGFSMGVFHFGKLNYEHRVEVCTGAFLVIFFISITILGFSQGFFVG